LSKTLGLVEDLAHGFAEPGADEAEQDRRGRLERAEPLAQPGSRVDDGRIDQGVQRRCADQRVERVARAQCFEIALDSGEMVANVRDVAFGGMGLGCLGGREELIEVARGPLHIALFLHDAERQFPLDPLHGDLDVGDHPDRRDQQEGNQHGCPDQ
jgi:hypothetical protein